LLRCEYSNAASPIMAMSSSLAEVVSTKAKCVSDMPKRLGWKRLWLAAARSVPVSSSTSSSQR
jgi:hypothetical protein